MIHVTFILQQLHWLPIYSNAQFKLYGGTVKASRAKDAENSSEEVSQQTWLQSTTSSKSVAGQGNLGEGEEPVQWPLDPELATESQL